MIPVMKRSSLGSSGRSYSPVDWKAKYLASQAEVQGLTSRLQEMKEEEENSRATACRLIDEASCLAGKLKDEEEISARLREEFKEAQGEIDFLRGQLEADDVEDALDGQIAAQAVLIEQLQLESKELNERLARAVSVSRAKDAEVGRLTTKVNNLLKLLERNQLTQKEAFRFEFRKDGKIVELEQEVNNLRSKLAEWDLANKVISTTDQSTAQKTRLAKPPRAESKDSLASFLEYLDYCEKGKQPGIPAPESPEPGTTVINIHLDPTDKSNWNWVKRMRAAVDRRKRIQIFGTWSQVVGLQKDMDDHDREYNHLRKVVPTLESTIRRMEGEAIRIKERPPCTIRGHQGLEDALKAKTDQLNLNEMMLRQYGQRVQDLEHQLRQRRA